jgi:hypothetical protein
MVHLHIAHGGVSSRLVFAPYEARNETGDQGSQAVDSAEIIANQTAVSLLDAALSNAMVAQCDHSPMTWL